MSKQLDNFFKKKLLDRSFEYEDSAWEDARLLIEENEKHKKRRKWFILFSGVLLVSLVGITAYYIGRESVQPKVEPKPSKVIADKEVESDIFSANPSTSKQLRDVEKESIENKLENAESNIKLAHIKDRHLNNANLNSNVNIDNQSININTKERNQNASGAAGVEHLTNRPITTTYNPHMDTAATLKQKQTNILENTRQENNKLATALPLTNKLDHLDFAINNSLIDLLPEMISAPETVISANLKNKWFFGLRLGAIVAPSAFTNFDGGGFIQYNINRNISLSLQPHYTYQEVSQVPIEEIVFINGFGLQTASFSLSPESIRSIHAPLLVSYSFGSGDIDLTDSSTNRFMKHKLSAGVSYVYLDGIRGSILENETAASSSNVEQGWFDASTFTRHNAELLLGYEYFLSKRFSLGTLFRYRLKNQFSNTFEQQYTSLEQPSSFYLGLQALYRIN